MYTVFSDDTLIYDSILDDYKITSGVVTKEVNKSGSFVFTMYRDNPFYDRIQKLKSIITVKKNNNIIFRGRSINEDLGFFNDKTLTCEGELSFFLDSIQRPFQFIGTPEELLVFLVTNHNNQVDASKQFKIGEVTVTSDVEITRNNVAYEDTLTNISKLLLEVEGGYLHITRDDTDLPVLNWFADYPYESNQAIEFGENLLDFTKTNNADSIVTAIIPLGAKIGEGENEAETRLTIENVNSGFDYIYDEKAVEKYGYIYSTITWDEITDPTQLLEKARAYLVESINQNITIELSAIDLSLLDRSIDSFRLGDYIRITSEPHGLDDRLLLEKQTIDLLKPENDQITLGYTYSSFTDKTLSSINQNTSLVTKVETIEANYAVNTVVTQEVENLRTLIDQTSTAISTEVLADYVVNDQLAESLSTLYTQLNDLFEFKFTNLETTVNENDTERRREIREITSYIRFEDGNIILGESGNELTVRIENDRLSFLEGGVEVAYVSNQKLYITDTDVIKSLRIGNFAFIPRANGNLSFKKIGG